MSSISQELDEFQTRMEQISLAEPHWATKYIQQVATKLVVTRKGQQRLMEVQKSLEEIITRHHSGDKRNPKRFRKVDQGNKDDGWDTRTRG